MNALDTKSVVLYRTMLETAEADPQVKVVVLTGAGRAFCAGADLHETPPPPEDAPDPMNQHDIATLVTKPVIAAINGAAVGLGYVEALGSDVRFAKRDAKLVSIFSRFGLTPEVGVAWDLVASAGVGRALDLLWTGRPITGEEAFGMGIVEYLEVEDVLQEAVAYATALADERDIDVLRQIKAQTYAAAIESRELALYRARVLLADKLKSQSLLERR